MFTSSILKSIFRTNLQSSSPYTIGIGTECDIAHIFICFHIKISNLISLCFQLVCIFEPSFLMPYITSFPNSSVFVFFLWRIYSQLVHFPPRTTVFCAFRAFCGFGAFRLCSRIQHLSLVCLLFRSSLTFFINISSSSLVWSYSLFNVIKSSLGCALGLHLRPLLLKVFLSTMFRFTKLNYGFWHSESQDHAYTLHDTILNQSFWARHLWTSL